MSNKVLKILNKYESILIVGPYPPPLGGVSVYVKRLISLTKNPKVFDTSIEGWFKFFKLFSALIFGRQKIVHVHVLTIKILTIVFLTKFFRSFEVMLTDHNSRIFLERSKFEVRLLKYFLGKSDYLVVVGKHIKKVYEAEGVKGRFQDIIICDSFLPPNQDEETSILTTYPNTYFDFLKSHSLIVSANAYKLVFKDGVDLYGIDMCIDLLKRLKKEFKGIGLVIFLADRSSNTNYFDKLKSLIHEFNLEKDVIFVTGQKELWPSFKKADLMVRPTYSDGFGISIAEAIYFGCPALASDVCERATGTILFSNRDSQDFYIKAKQILSRRL
jgi:glycosyltransferase involved in cell wall biosynthesis